MIYNMYTYIEYISYIRIEEYNIIIHIIEYHLYISIIPYHDGIISDIITGGHFKNSRFAHPREIPRDMKIDNFYK